MSQTSAATSEAELVSPITYPTAIALGPISPGGPILSRTFSTTSSRIQQQRQRSQLVIQDPEKTRGKTFIVISSTTVITGISSLLAGVVTVSLPTIAMDLHLGESLLLWPTSIFSLTCGCTLLLSGSVADVVGSRVMYLIGSLLQSIFTLACGLSRTSYQLILFRGLAGIAISLCLPSAVSIITNSFPEGKHRNIAFASMGGAQPIGFSIGLTLGGVFADTIGWRYGFYVAAILNTIVFVLAVWGLPRTDEVNGAVTWSRIRTEIDWVGATIASVSLAVLSYVLAAVTGNMSSIHQPATIALLATGIALIPAFILWVGRQERLGKPAIVPNSLWRNKVFTSICVGVFLTWGIFNAVENYVSFTFQYVQEVSAIQTSLRFLPEPAGGAVTNLVMGLIVHRVRADWAVLVTTSVSTISCLLMALIDINASYWAFAFPSILLNPVGADTLFTIANLLITSVFPAKTQALAGGVFNTVAQIGKTVGLATSAVIASSITARAAQNGASNKVALLKGYQAAFWYCFALSLATLAISAWGLRKIGKVGTKRD